MDPKKMKIIKSQLREIIREEIQNLKEGLPWERELDEGWFSDLSAKAKQTYLKANPNSKYAKDVKSGERDAPMTGKEKATQADRETQVKKDNVDNYELEANDNAAEDTSTEFIDIVSNGFKNRDTTDPNVAETYLYMAFASSPFKYSNAR